MHGLGSHHTAPSPLSPLISNRLSRLVLETLEPLPGDRKCFRMINGVLVERTVKDVVPALRTNAEGLKKVLDDLVKQYKAKQDELEKWKVSHADRSPSAVVIAGALTFIAEEEQRPGCTVMNVNKPEEPGRQQATSKPTEVPCHQQAQRVWSNICRSRDGDDWYWESPRANDVLRPPTPTIPRLARARYRSLL